jgi:hypothetical protein
VARARVVGFTALVVTRRNVSDPRSGSLIFETSCFSELLRAQKGN